MAFFTDLSERFWSYVSPRKTQQRRDKPFKVPAKPTRKKSPPPRLTPAVDNGDDVADPARYSMSPNTRVKSWRVSRAGSRTPGKPRTPGSAKTAGSVKTPRRHQTPSVSSVAGTPTMGGFVGSTLLGEEADASMNANDETLVETKYELSSPKYFNLHKERERQERQAGELRHIGWSEDAIRLFQKIGMRGYEPLLPRKWELDFQTIPTELFSTVDEEVFLKSASGKQFRATKALSTLIAVGARARDIVFSTTTSKEPEQVLLSAITNYAKWAVADGVVNKASNIPIFDFQIGDRNVEASELEALMTAKLSRLASRYRDAFRVEQSVESDDGGDGEDGGESYDPPSEDMLYSHKLPSLYGFVISHTIVAVVNYDITAFAPKLRIIATFDFGEPGYDVWNALGVAIVAVHCRNKMMELAPVMPAVESEIEDSDPDA